jgi:hypothetical protein
VRGTLVDHRLRSTLRLAAAAPPEGVEEEEQGIRAAPADL